MSVYNFVGLVWKIHFIYLVLLSQREAVLGEDLDTITESYSEGGGSRKETVYTNDTSKRCVDELPEELCDEVVGEQCNRENTMTTKCRRSCRLCAPSLSEREWTSNEDRASKCKDALQQCEVIANPCICCLYKPIANVTCQRSCRFCYDLQSVPGVPFMPGFPGSPPGVEQPVVYQDPCNPTKPPTVSGGPQVPGGNPPAQSVPGMSNIPGGSNPSGSGNNNAGGGTAGIPGSNSQSGIGGSNNGVPVTCTANTAGMPTG